MGKWSITKAAIWGSLCGLVIGAAREIVETAPSTEPPIRWVGDAIGAAISGAILSIAVAAIRNAVARA